MSSAASSINTFFGSWGMSDDASRAAAIQSVYTENGTYADPRSQGTLQGTSAIAGYVNMFSANAPGWSARVVKSDDVGGCTRATIAFCGTGPDGKEMVQHGQYFVETEEGKITRMLGFAGTGAPE